MPGYTLLPSPGHVLAEVIKSRDNVYETQSGLLQPENKKYERLSYAKVVSSSAQPKIYNEADNPLIPMFQPDAVIVFQKLASHHVLISGKELLLIPFEHILGAVYETPDTTELQYPTPPPMPPSPATLKAIGSLDNTTEDTNDAT